MGNYSQESNLEYRGKPSRKAFSSANAQVIASQGRGPTMQKVIRDVQTKQKLGRYKTSR